MLSGGCSDATVSRVRDRSRRVTDRKRQAGYTLVLVVTPTRRCSGTVHPSHNNRNMDKELSLKDYDHSQDVAVHDKDEDFYSDEWFTIILRPYRKLNKPTTGRRWLFLAGKLTVASTQDND